MISIVIAGCSFVAGLIYLVLKLIFWSQFEVGWRRS